MPSFRIPKLHGISAMVLAATLLPAAVCVGQEPAAAAEAGFVQQHPWRRFPSDSWKSVRVISETLDEQGNVANVIRTETRTTLIIADARGYSLRADSTVEVAGQRFASLPQVVRRGYYGETAGQSVTVKKLREEELVIDGRAVPSEVRQAAFEEDGIKRISTIHYSSRVWPFQLRRETVTEGGPDDQQSKTVVETVALQLPQKVLSQLRSSAVVKTTRKSPQGTKVTLEIHCEDVPGGLVGHSASETDATGRVVRRSTLELIDFGIGGHPPTADPVTRRRNFHRQRPRRMD